MLLAIILTLTLFAAPPETPVDTEEEAVFPDEAQEEVVFEDEEEEAVFEEGASAGVLTMPELPEHDPEGWLVVFPLAGLMLVAWSVRWRPRQRDGVVK